MRHSLNLLILILLVAWPVFSDNKIQAKITSLNFLKKLVTVEICSGAVEITFRSVQKIEHFSDFGLAQLRFDCARDSAACDFKNPYLFSVNSEKAEIIEWKFKTPVWAWVAHGPGDGDYPDGFILDAEIGGQQLFLQLKIDPSSLRRIRRVSYLKRGAWVLINFPADKPAKALIRGLSTTIVVFKPE